MSQRREAGLDGSNEDLKDAAGPEVGSRAEADSAASGRETQISFRLRSELAREIREAALAQRVSVQTFVLTALKAAGIGVLDTDLTDLRRGGPRASRRTASLDPLGVRRLASDPGNAAQELLRILSDARELLARGSSVQAGTSVVINIGDRHQQPGRAKLVNKRNKRMRR